MKKNTVTIDLGTIENTCFVVMPFDPLFKMMYDRVIQPAVEELNIECIRGDEIYSKQSIVDDIWKALREAKFVIAELTGRNPNVLYEIGLAHALGKPIILLTRNEEDVPFDLKGLRYTFYDISDPFWGDNLKSSLRTMVQNVRDQPDLSRHLEGVQTKINETGPVIEFQLEKLNEPDIPKVSGNWKATWQRFGAKIKHSGTVIITQNEEKLSAIMIVTFEKDGKQTIVQETLIGSAINDQIVLEGISYTYLEQGNSSSYLLDNFDLKLTGDKHKLSGQFRSRLGLGKAAFKRIEEVKP